MKLHFKKSQDLIFVDKPTGFSTHSKDSNSPGLREILQKQLAQKLFLVPHSDLHFHPQTTGGLLFATSEEAAKSAGQKFHSSQVSLTYFFVTAKVSSTGELSFPNNPSTKFLRVKRSPFFELWQVTSNRDQGQQILELAKSVGLDVLGSETSKFPHLCLHLAEIQVSPDSVFEAPIPRFFERLGALKDVTLVQWLLQVDRRQRFFNFLSQPQQCLRLIHTESLRVDLLGPQLWIYWYGEQIPGPIDLERVEALARFLGRPFLLKKMQNRGSNPGEKIEWTSPDWITNWTACESDVIYQFSSTRGQSPGLFLDQRLNRAQVQMECHQQTVLNLFAYTCGFSVVAALGRAATVTSVDVSSTFLNWGKENFHLNKVDSSQYEFFCQDVLLFLKGCLKRQRRFDLIVCDPPSFGRNKDQIFKLEQDLDFLLISTWNCLEQGGRLLFSCNLEKWTMKTLRSRLQKILPEAQIENGPQGWDFELPGEEPLLKSLTLRKARSV